MAAPDFASTTKFPTFNALPEVIATGPSPGEEEEREEWFLLAQVKDDMTITKPTLVLGDREGSPFALVFNGLERGDLDLKKLGLKKGATAVVPRARRTPPKEETKRGFVAVEKGRAEDVKAIPGPLARVLELGAGMAGRRGQTREVCEACGKGAAEQESALLKCTGCGEVRYCSKLS